MANTIASERKLLGLSQQQLGDLIGKDRSTIGRWEANPMIIDGLYLSKLSEIFGCSVDYILGRTGERSAHSAAPTA